MVWHPGFKRLPQDQAVGVIDPPAPLEGRAGNDVVDRITHGRQIAFAAQQRLVPPVGRVPTCGDIRPDAHGVEDSHARSKRTAAADERRPVPGCLADALEDHSKGLRPCPAWIMALPPKCTGIEEVELQIFETPFADRRRHQSFNVFSDLRVSHIQSAGESITDESGINWGPHPIPQDPTRMIRQNPCSRPGYEGSEPQAGDEAGPMDPAADSL